MFTSSERLLGDTGPDCRPGAPRKLLHDVRASYDLEAAESARLPAHALIERAGLAVAQLAISLAPHARTVWIACGPGNNGGDGLVAARHLFLFGKKVVVTLLSGETPTQQGVLRAIQLAHHAGVLFATSPPETFDLCIDALFGIGPSRPMERQCAQWVDSMNMSGRPVLSVDVPSGLDADTGTCLETCVHASTTLCLLTLKPGLFTGRGRDVCGSIWLDKLGIDDQSYATGILNAAVKSVGRIHDSHKGTYGDVVVVGGAKGMVGAALLAARAALHGGAGRVYVGLLHDEALRADEQQAELMFRAWPDLPMTTATVVAGCGGGDSIGPHLTDILNQASRLVLDADALNAIAASSEFQTQLRRRPLGSTVMTPHPLEAARLLDSSAQTVQKNRVVAATSLAQRFACTVILKGSGSIIASPGTLPCINPTGNARLASAGTGDVLAGFVGSLLASGISAHDAACQATFRHGAIADHWPHQTHLTAQLLSAAL
jgi:hydroxyethylthiazole kinase-like uncharacterized protein yjeF